MPDSRRRVLATPLALAALTCVVETAGCRDILGVEQRQVARGADGWPLPAACATCVASTCDEAAAACEGDAACHALAECMLSVPDDPIGRMACLDADRTTAEDATFIALDACLRGACQTSCYVGGRGLLAGYGAYRDGCFESIEAELAACVAEADCERVAVDALADPNGIDPASYEPLRHAIGDAGAAKRALAAKFTRAEDACIGGLNMACVGAYEWPLPEGDVTSVPFEAYLPVQLNIVPVPTPGVALQGCFASDDCSATEPFFTDAGGLATTDALAVPTTGFRSYFRIDAGTSPTPVFPTIAFAGFPIHEGVRLDAFVSSTSDAQLFLDFGGGTLNEGRGLLALIFLDCQQNVVPGLRLEFPAAFLEGATLTYLTSESSTGFSGTAGVVNAPPGCVEFRARDGDGNETHRARVIVEAGRATLSSVFPVTTSRDRIVNCARPEFPLDPD